MSDIKMDDISSARPGNQALKPYVHQDDELDLLGLLSILLNRKFFVIAITGLAVLAGAGMSYLIPQRWTSSAVLVPAEAPQLRSMEKILTELNVLDIKTDITPDSLLSDFMRNFDSRSLREKYLVNTTYFKELAKDKADTPDTRNRLVNAILQGNIDSHSSVQDKDAAKKEYRYYEIKYTAENPVAARDLLEGYINYVSDVVQSELHQRINYQIDMLKGKAIGQYNLDVSRAENAHRIKLERLQYALQIANSAGLKQPSWSNGRTIQDDPDFSVTLGADGLARKLQIEQAISDPARLSADLQNRRLYIEKLNAVKINELHVEPFKYMRAPYEPIQRDAPKRSLIVLLFGLAGLIASCSYVLLNHAMKNRSQPVDLLPKRLN
ncbi:MAG TPA: LPS O-antigen length regulator [Erwinia persicina]|uniref:LPS O-antigen length regulator n=1 Tax=Erwinia persicina TaxID=55211 RepID=A0A3S7TFM3_9GAMM|nr:LPS O-antigen length regulator Wzz(fepE) [Erwinia persicina]AXU97666.1 LPS O-antigen length regulator [Erwinia persicina]MBC3945166.1 LPS O-antigen length regulator [Erwinia persicina]MBD8107198.1 LPS O-antigen length regulator [Erwinia persicina]MBD8210278.1 LPS O-antigen length regulator [Erwinia persicina]MCQ4094905.1 LPS O-antigen length regulator Wzz(fepE) [Erwinia persicina]